MAEEVKEEAKQEEKENIGKKALNVGGKAKAKMGSLVDEFKTFAFKGNIVDMAIGVIIGGAFGKIVSSFVASLVMPLVTGFIAGFGAQDAEKSLKALTFKFNGVDVPYGVFLGECLDFFIVALVVFIVMKKFLGFVQNMRKKEEEPVVEEAPAAPAEPELTADQKLLTEIRDLLQAQANK